MVARLTPSWLLINNKRLQKPEGMPTTIYFLLQSCWSPLPSNRPTFSELYTKMNPAVTEQDDDNTIKADISRMQSRMGSEIELENYFSESDADVARALTTSAESAAAAGAVAVVRPRRVTTRRDNSINRGDTRRLHPLQLASTPIAESSTAPQPPETPLVLMPDDSDNRYNHASNPRQPAEVRGIRKYASMPNAKRGNQGSHDHFYDSNHKIFFDSNRHHDHLDNRMSSNGKQLGNRASSDTSLPRVAAIEQPSPPSQLPGLRRALSSSSSNRTGRN